MTPENPSPWPSAYSGWYTSQRSIGQYTGSPILASMITPQTVKLAMLRDAPVKQDIFSAAILEFDSVPGTNAPNSLRILLDVTGELYEFHNLAQSATSTTSTLESNFHHLTSTLTSRVLSLPKTGSFRNTWFIEQATTSQPLDRLFVPDGSTPHFEQITISGYPFVADPKRTSALPLTKVVDKYTTLPLDLDELFGLILEARTNISGDELKNAELVNAIKRVILKESE